MKISFSLAGEVDVVEAQRQGSDLVAKVGEKDVSAEALWLSKNELSLTIDGRSYDVEIYPAGANQVEISIGGQVVMADFTDPLSDKAMAKGRGRQSGVVNSPMPGKVVVVLASEGQEVAAGDGIVVVEAMKMENEIQAPISGVVKRVAVGEGDVVASGALLMEIGEC